MPVVRDVGLHRAAGVDGATMKNERACEPIWVDDGDKRACLQIYWGARLPLESNPLYADAVLELRGEGRCVVQVTNLFSTDGMRLMRRLLKTTLARAIELGATDIVAVVSPRHARNYASLYFEDMLPDDPPRMWDWAWDRDGVFLKTRLIRLDITAVPPAILALWSAAQSAEV